MGSSHGKSRRRNWRQMGGGHYGSLENVPVVECYHCGGWHKSLTEARECGSRLLSDTLARRMPPPPEPDGDGVWSFEP